eukprot:8088169-Pyramimonas_sp.AAC.1
MGQPFILGGDWNVAPEMLVASGWPSAVGGSIVTTGAYTCRSSGSSSTWSCLDYFVVSAGFLHSVKNCRRQEDCSTAPHWAVNME